MKTFSMTEAESAERSFGSTFGPLLNGVAHGLAKLFPPIENARRPEPEHRAGRVREDDDEASDE